LFSERFSKDYPNEAFLSRLALEPRVYKSPLAGDVKSQLAVAAGWGDADQATTRPIPSSLSFGA
jgi:hypothetical protein